jgi:hypothetical protein
VISPGHLVDAQVEIDELPDVFAGKPRPDAIKTVLRLNADNTAFRMGA